MNGRTLIMVVIAIAIAIATVMVVKSRAAPVAHGGPRILMATTDIPAGSFVRADKQLAWVNWPQGDIAPSFITPEAHKIEEFNGAVARRSLVAGEPITLTSMVRANEGGFMSAVLSPGKRAVSIAVSPTSGNAGFIFPGDKVDLILTHKVSGGLASETFIEELRVLAIDQMLDNPDNKAVIAKTITLEVTPKQAEMINVAINLGTISVSLRSLAKDATRAASPRDITAEEPRSKEDNYSTDSDVSKLVDSKNAVRSKVRVYHGTSSEQLDFH